MENNPEKNLQELENQETELMALKSEQFIQENKWHIKASDRTDEGRRIIKDILKKFKLVGLYYSPSLLIEKDGYEFFIILSEKTTFPMAKNKDGSLRMVSGIDWFKYKLSLYIEAKTGIQVGLIMYNKEAKSLVFRQLNQLAKPIPWFSGGGCLLNLIKYQENNPLESRQVHIDRVFSDPEIDFVEKMEIGHLKEHLVEAPYLKCIECFQTYPELSHRCLKGKRKRIKVMAIWNVESFEQRQITVQPQLLLR